jgi:hypothetical protein
MPDLRWSELDFLEYLSVAPTVEEYGTSHAYNFSREGLEALLTLWKHESFAMFSLRYADTRQVLLDASFFIRGDATVRRHVATGEPCLYFADCIVAPDRFAYRDMQDPFDQKRYPTGVDIRLSIDPRISFRLLPRHDSQ